MIAVKITILMTMMMITATITAMAMIDWEDNDYHDDPYRAGSDSEGGVVMTRITTVMVDEGGNGS